MFGLRLKNTFLFLLAHVSLDPCRMLLFDLDTLHLLSLTLYHPPDPGGSPLDGAGVTGANIHE